MVHLQNKKFIMITKLLWWYKIQWHSHKERVVWLFLIMLLPFGDIAFEFAAGKEWALVSAASSGGEGGKRRVRPLLRQKEIAGITGPYTSLNCSARGSPFLGVGGNNGNAILMIHAISTLQRCILYITEVFVTNQLPCMWSIAWSIVNLCSYQALCLILWVAAVEEFDTCNYSLNCVCYKINSSC